MNDKSADIVFEVGGNKVKDNAMKVAKTEPVLFPAHRCIVENCSIIFAELCESNGEDKTTPISISGVSLDVFRFLLFYMYGGKVSDDNMTTHAKEIIDAADRYGISSLKLEAEVCLVNATIFGVENLKDILLYADSKNCALLKEAAMDYMAENKDKVRGKISFHDAPGSLLNDFIEAISRGESKGSQGTDDNNVDNQYNTLRISELRKKAYEIGLNVDGSREMLIAALKKANELESKDNSEESDEEPVEE
jgi:speckle-type POZ protein